MADDPSLAGLPGPPPPRPVLRPGLHVVRRDDRQLQIGIDPPHRLIVEDHPDVRRVLGDLRTGGSPAPTTPVGHLFLTRLLDAGLLVDATRLEAALAGPADRAAVLACFAQFGDDAGARLAARATARVGVDAPADLSHAAGRLLRAAGVGLAGDEETPTAELVVAGSELPRGRLDPAVRAGRPHLVVTGGTTGVTLGPFVVAGTTACLRCVDAHRGESDPRRAMVVEQCAHRTPDGGEPRDAALLATAVAWAVRDLVSFVDGDRPATWSTTVTLGPGLAEDRRVWTRHPHCGCSWGEELVG